MRDLNGENIASYWMMNSNIQIDDNIDCQPFITKMKSIIGPKFTNNCDGPIFLISFFLYLLLSRDWNIFHDRNTISWFDFIKGDLFYSLQLSPRQTYTSEGKLNGQMIYTH